MSPTSARDPGRAGRADAVNGPQLRPAGRHRLGQLGLERLDSRVELDQIGQLLGGQPPAGASELVTRPHRREHDPVLSDRLLRRHPTGDQFGQQPVHPVQPLRPGLGQLVAAVAQHPQQHQPVIDAQLAQPGVPQRDHHHRVRIGGVGLTALPGVEHPHPGGQLGLHIQHSLPVGE